MARLFQNDKALANFDQREPSGLDAASFLSRQTSRIVNSQLETANRIIVSQDRIASGIDEINFGINSGFDRLSDGLESLASAFDWGFAELIWQMEQQRKELGEILNRLDEPLGTAARELKRRAQKHYNNKWFDDALEDFLESEKKNKYDFIVQQYLGNIYFFNKNEPERALEHYEKAAKYAEPESSYHASYALIHIALMHYLKKDFKKSYDATSKAIKLSPNLYEAHYQHAKYCANLGKYDEAIKHINEAQIGDKYYCVKADSEKDFQVMKKQLLSFFEWLRVNAQKEAEIELNKAQELVQSAESQGTVEYAPDSFELAKNELTDAKNFFSRKSYFDYLDAKWKAKETQKVALDSSIKSLSNQINETNNLIYETQALYRKASEDDKRVKNSFEGWVKIISFIAFLIGAIVTELLFGYRLFPWTFFLCLIISGITYHFQMSYIASPFRSERYEMEIQRLKGYVLFLTNGKETIEGEKKRLLNVVEKAKHHTPFGTFLGT